MNSDGSPNHTTVWKNKAFSEPFSNKEPVASPSPPDIINPKHIPFFDTLSIIRSSTTEPFMEGARNRKIAKSKSRPQAKSKSVKSKSSRRKSKSKQQSTPQPPPPPPPPPKPSSFDDLLTPISSNVVFTRYGRGGGAASFARLRGAAGVGGIAGAAGGVGAAGVGGISGYENSVEYDNTLDEDIPLDKNQVIIENTDETSTTKLGSASASKKGPKTKTQLDLAIDALLNYGLGIKQLDRDMQGKKFNFDKLYTMIAKAILFLPNAFDLILNIISAWYLERINHMSGREYKNEMSKNYVDLLSRVQFQVKSVAYFLVSIYMVLNWWYSFNYFHRFFSTASMVDLSLIPPLKIVLESNMAFTNLINYLLFGIKLDESRIPVSKDICETLWEYRPYVFVVFFTIFQAVYSSQKTNIEKKFFDAMTRKTNDLSGANIFFTFMSWIKLDMMWPERMGQRMAVFQNFFITFFVVLLKLVLILAFLPLGIMFLYLFLYFWSYFPLAVFNGSGMIDMIKAMFIDLSTTVNETQDETFGHKLYRFLVNNSVPLTFFLTAISILMKNTVKGTKGLKPNNVVNSLLYISIAVLIIAVGSFLWYLKDATLDVFGSAF